MQRAVDRTSTVKLLLMLAMCTSLSGCFSWFADDWQDPQIKLLKVDVVKAKLLEQEFLLHLRIDNPNDEDLPIRGLTYSLYLNDIKLADGESDVWLTVPANGHEHFTIPLRTNLWRNLKPIAKMLEKHDEPIRYRFQGDAETGIVFGRSVHMQRNGEIIPGDKARV